MSLHTNLTGRLRNTNLPKTHGLMPVFEAVVNSIQSLEEAGRLAKGQIVLEIMRNTQQQVPIEKSGAQEVITGFTVTDNGVGFNDTNMQSFETLDSDHKVDKGCRGIGRLLWLKTFDKAEVESVFHQGGAFHRRNFSFTAQNGIQVEVPREVEDRHVETILKLEGFAKEYYACCRKTAEGIADALLEHCLWYFVRSDGTPNIVVKDGAERVVLARLYDQRMHAEAKTESVTLKGYPFGLTHIKFRAGGNKNHSMFLCAASRVVREESISKKVPGLFGTIEDEDGEFIYACYVTSPYLDEHVRSERTGFNIAESAEGVIDDVEISLNEIREKVVERTRDYLSSYLDGNMKAGRERVDSFISHKAPRYRSIVGHMDATELVVDPGISDKDLEIHLHKQYYKAEKALLEEGHEVMNPVVESNLTTYRKQLDSYLQKAKDFKQSDLANYVTHRRTIIDLLEKHIAQLDNGKYSREDFIHQLIMPMRKDSEQTPLDACNLWLIDERLAFHDYLGSITVVEIKRPMRNDAREGEEKDPIEQALKYLDRIRQGQVKTANGLLIPNSRDVPGFCYVVCDLTPTVLQRCKIFDLTPTHDHMGYFGYSKSFGAFIEVISYNRLVQSAKERNRAFFEQLGLPA
ncbi:hypothetical protein [Sansalvadorimonas verongulae]|uniref:hypothetical protein n=1 Tax=Sansalvadorimonas verongulae TaxID=2172824 RepID=UPI001E598315|nr:hypothetical protein [Sansalvadorimonas verongulae]MTI12073.1 ATP-binding protein [Sansalvadorimonas verongulae]